MALFGYSKEEIWKELCKEINADFVNDGFLKGSRVEVKYLNWTIYLDTYTVSAGQTVITYTRMRSPFIFKEKFYFKIYNSGMFSDIGKFFGLQDIEVGYEEFDRNFIIQGDNDDFIKKLFSNSKIRELIKVQPKINFEVKQTEGMFGPHFEENEKELYFLVPGVIKDLDSLKNLLDLFTEVLDELNNLGVTSSEPSSTKLYK